MPIKDFIIASLNIQPDKIQTLDTGNWHIKKKRGFATKRDAKEAERQMAENSDTSGLITLKTIAEQYDSYKQLSPDQHRKHQVHFEKRFSEYYNSPISKITVPRLVAWQTDLAKSTACSTKNNHFGSNLVPQN